MKINQLLLRIILITILFVVCSSHILYASEPTQEPIDSSEVMGDENQMLPSLGEGYRPTVTSGTKAIDIISQILGVINVLGIISMVVAVALLGFGAILGSANDKAVNQEKYVGIFIASLLLTGGSALARMIISAAENIM